MEVLIPGNRLTTRFVWVWGLVWSAEQPGKRSSLGKTYLFICLIPHKWFCDCYDGGVLMELFLISSCGGSGCSNFDLTFQVPTEVESLCVFQQCSPLRDRY